MNQTNPPNQSGATRIASALLSLILLLPACAHQTALPASVLDDPNPPALTCAELQGEVVALRKAFKVLSADLTTTQVVGGIAIVIEGVAIVLTNVWTIPTATKKAAEGIAAGMR